jgi:hypothetical protein
MDDTQQCPKCGGQALQSEFKPGVEGPAGETRWECTGCGHYWYTDTMDYEEELVADRDDLGRPIEHRVRYSTWKDPDMAPLRMWTVRCSCGWNSASWILTPIRGEEHIQAVKDSASPSVRDVWARQDAAQAAAVRAQAEEVRVQGEETRRRERRKHFIAAAVAVVIAAAVVAVLVVVAPYVGDFLSNNFGNSAASPSPPPPPAGLAECREAAAATDELVQGMIDVDAVVIDERRARFRRISRLVDACVEAADGAAPSEERAACVAATKTGVDIVKWVEMAFTWSGPEEDARVMLNHVTVDLIPQYTPARDACFS